MSSPSLDEIVEFLRSRIRKKQQALGESSSTRGQRGRRGEKEASITSVRANSTSSSSLSSCQPINEGQDNHYNQDDRRGGNAATGGGGCQDSDPRPVVQDIELSVEELNGVLQFLLRSKTDGQRRRPDPTSGTSSFSRFANTETGTVEHRGAPLDSNSKLQRMTLLKEAYELFQKSQYRDAEHRSLELLEIARHSHDTTNQANALNIAGNSQQYLGKHRASLHSFEQMLALPQSPKHQKTVQQQAYIGIGDAYSELGEHAKAIENFEKVAAIAEQLNDISALGTAITNLGIAHGKMGQYTRAIEYFEKDLAIAEQLNDKSQRAKTYRNLGNAYSAIGECTRAIEYYEKGLTIAEQINDTSEIGNTICNLGTTYTKISQYTRAIEYYEKALAIAEQHNDISLRASVYGGLGIAYNEMGQYTKAIEYYEKRLALAEQLNDTPLRSSAYDGLASAYMKMNQYTKAIEYFEKALAIQQQLNDTPGRRVTFANLGDAYFEMGKYTRAVEYYEKALAIAEQLNDTTDKGGTYINQGNAYTKMGQYTRGIKCYKKALTIAEQLNDPPLRANAHGGLGTAYNEMGEYTKAIDSYEKALATAEQLNGTSLLVSLYDNLGSAHRNTGEYTKAIEYYEKCLAIATKPDVTPELGNVYNSLGVAYSAMGEYTRAIEYYDKRLAITEQLNDTPGRGVTYGSLGTTYGKMGQHTRAIEYLEKSSAIAQELGDMPLQALALGNLGITCTQSGQLALACSHFASADAVVRQIEAPLSHGEWRRHLLAFGERLTGFMESWVVSAARSGDMVEALQVEERRRCRSELAYQAEAGRDRQVEGGIVDVSMDELKAMAKSAGASFVIVYKIVDRALLTWVLSGETGELVYDRCLDKAYEPDQIGEWIDSALFLELPKWRAATRYIGQRVEKAFDDKLPNMREELKKVIEDRIPAAMKGDLDDELWSSIRSLHTYLHPESRFDELLSQVYDHFFEKANKAMDNLSELLLEPILQGCPALKRILECNTSCAKPIYFLPDSLLSLVPFCALKVSGRFLIEKALVAQAPSLRILDCARARYDAIKNDTRLPSEALMVSYEPKKKTQESLAKYREELERVLPVDMLCGPSASKEAVIDQVTRGSSSLIHFLVHGTAGDFKEDWGGVYLAENEVLSAYELHERFTDEKASPQNVLTRLLVLCACSSGRGRLMREGVQGFARAALAGGIPCLLASKWNVPAKESILLMTLVYALMAKDKGEYKTVAEAFQAAVVSLLADNEMNFKRSHFYWAAFIIHGFASVRLDNTLLDQIHDKLEIYQSENMNDSNDTLEMALVTLTQDANDRLEDWERSLSHEWW